MDHHVWDERYGSSELIWTATPNRVLVAEVAGLAPGRALDIARGEGRNAVWLAAQGWDLTGVDFSHAGLDKARHLAHQRGVAVEWILADVATYRPPAAAFDLVVVLYLQLPAEPLAMALGNAVTALAPPAQCSWSATTSPTSPTATADPRTPRFSTPPTRWPAPPWARHRQG